MNFRYGVAVLVSAAAVLTAGCGPLHRQTAAPAPAPVVSLTPTDAPNTQAGREEAPAPTVPPTAAAAPVTTTAAADDSLSPAEQRFAKCVQWQQLVIQYQNAFGAASSEEDVRQWVLTTLLPNRSDWAAMTPNEKLTAKSDALKISHSCD